MSQKGLAPIFLIVTVLVIAAIAFFIFPKFSGQGSGPGPNGQNQPGWGQRPGGAQDFGGPPQNAKRERWSGPIPTPPKNKITYYKGLWAGPWFYPEEYTGQKLELDKYGKWGVNIMMIQPGFEINKKGEVRYPPDFPTYEDMDARIGELATKFYSANIHVGLTMIVTYRDEFSKGGNEKWAGEPQPYPKEVIEQPGYFDKLNKVIEDMAKIAEKYHIYLFSPPGEADNIFGMSVAPKWIQQVAPLIKKNYTGKLYYKGDLHEGQGDQISFKGYDVLGFVTRPTNPKDSAETLRRVFDEDMDRALGWAKRDGVPEVVISEHGNDGNSENIKMASPENFGVILEEGSKKLNGVFLSEPPSAVLKTPQGDQIVLQMQKWFSK